MSVVIDVWVCGGYLQIFTHTIDGLVLDDTGWHDDECESEIVRESLFG